MDIIKLKSFDNQYIDNLNLWQEKEKKLGLNGLDDFVVVKGVLLGDYLNFINKEIKEMPTLLAFHNENLIGFICYSQIKNNHFHIEIIATNPDFRGQDYSHKILNEFKIILQNKNSLKFKVTLSVNNKNEKGIKVFSKVATKSQIQDKENYTNFEL